MEALTEAGSDQEAGGTIEVKSPFQNFISKDAFSDNHYGTDKISIKSESVVDSTSRTSEWKDKKVRFFKFDTRTLFESKFQILFRKV